MTGNSFRKNYSNERENSLTPCGCLWSDHGVEGKTVPQQQAWMKWTATPQAWMNVSAGQHNNHMGRHVCLSERNMWTQPIFASP